MKNFLQPLLRAFLPAVLLACVSPRAAAAPPPPPLPASEPKNVAATAESVGPLLLRDESVEQVLALLERWTGKTILRPQALPGATITLTLRGSITKDEAIRALETLLSLNGIAITPLDDKFLKVTPLALAKSEAPELIDGSTLSLPASGRIVSKVFQLNFLRVSEFMPQVAGLLNPGTGSPPVIFEKANAALVTDSLSNLQRIETLVARLDQPLLAGLTPKFYQLHFAKASDVVNKMRTVLSGALQSQLGSATTYNADDRTNQIVLVADARQQPFFDDLITRLDVKSDPNTRNEVIYLKHAAAKDVASILSQLVSGQNNATKNSGQADASRLTGLPVGAPGSPAPGPAPAATVVPVAGLNLALEPSNQFSALLSVLPEERTNSIVVSGTVDDIRLIRELVDKIDILLAQVRIEVVIAEVALSDNATSGISALGLTITGDKLTGFSGNAAGIAVTNGVLTPGVVGAGPVDLAAQISLATSPRKSHANILSVPNIITTHNKEGHIFVGEQRPIISNFLNSGSAGAGNTGNNPNAFSSNVTYKDIGIDLKVKPLIGVDGSVQLEIKQEVNDILGNINIGGNDQPRIGRRSTESFVSVRSGEIIVLGGLQRTSQSRNTNRLGPIPILGDLLGARSREKTRTDLVFFLRPTVLTNTAADNSTALRQVEAFPKDQREQVKKVLTPTPPSGK
ncbi:MAG: type II secretory pathway, component PulD [Opitutae bacterium]|nr:type II secretory pathway, component PulD [Opitutae bacterium]